MEFVAKPSESLRAQTAVPAAIASTLEGVAGFAGCLVMSSDEESRLMRVITFWAGPERTRRCHENTRWLHKLLEPYVDGCLRVQTCVAHLQSAGELSPSFQVASQASDEPAGAELEAEPEEVFVS